MPFRRSTATTLLLALAPSCVAGGAAADPLAAELGQRVGRYVAVAIRQRIFPGAQVVVLRGDRILLDAAYGTETYDSGSPPITARTRYDLASLTKVVATTAVAMRLDAAGRVDLDQRAASLVPGFVGGGRDGVTLHQLLAHCSGLPGWKPLYRNAPDPQAVIDRLLAVPLATQPGRRTEYSDLGFLLLGLCLEKAGGAPLDTLAKTLVFDPLAMSSTSFGPIPPGLPVAPTEVVPSRGGLVRGRVHDENAAALGGVAGHAGLFSTARDVARFMRSILAGRPPFPPALTRRYTERAGLVIGSSRALGFDTPHADSSAGRRMSQDAFGHTGFTGTSAWADRPRDLVVVCLTNRVHPTRRNHGIRAFRRGLNDLVLETLAAGPAAAPTACNATTSGLEIASRTATPSWKDANIRLLTVLLPARKAPRAPIAPAKAGHTRPTLPATNSAITIGMLGRPAPFTPESM